MRILHLPTNVGSNPLNIHDALLFDGIHQSNLIIKSKIRDTKTFVYTRDILSSRNAKYVTPLNYSFIFEKYDVIHYNFGSTFSKRRVMLHSEMRPLQILKESFLILVCMGMSLVEILLVSKKSKIFVHYQGDDARPQTISSARNKNSMTKKFVFFMNLLNQKWHINLFSKYADKIFYLNPDLAKFLPLRAMFIPYSFQINGERTPNEKTSKGRKIVIGHAPSSRSIKGTSHILSTFENSVSVRKNFELRMIEGIPRKDVESYLQKCDIIIDQLLVGWYGAVSVEAMLLGKTVFCYLETNQLNKIPHNMRAELPIVQITVDTLEEMLLDYLKFSEIDKIDLKKRNLNFVRNWHDAGAINRKIYGQ